MPRRSGANWRKLGPPSHLEVIGFWIVGIVTTIASGGPLSTLVTITFGTEGRRKPLRLASPVGSPMPLSRDPPSQEAASQC